MGVFRVKTILVGIGISLGLAAAASAGPPTGDGKGADDKLALPLEGKSTPASFTAPSNDAMEREYPPLALSLGLTGEGTITCTVEPQGELDECHVDQEAPAGLGFGAAAVRLAPYFIVKPATFDGQPVKSKMTLPIRFQVGDATPGPPPPEEIGRPTSPEALVLARQVVALDDEAGRMRRNMNSRMKFSQAQIAAGGDATDGERVFDALRRGVEDAITDETDRRARLLAAGMTTDQLRATVAFLTTPAGVALRQAQLRTDDPQREAGMSRRFTWAMRNQICQQTKCEEGTSSTSPP